MSRKRPNNMVKILFPLETASVDGSMSETMWAEEIKEGHYKLRNSPFYALGISFEDTVTAVAEKENSQLVFNAVVNRGGHSTYRIMLKPNVDKNNFQNYWTPIKKLGCTYEEGKVLSVDVPPDANIYKVYELLEKGEKDEIWYFEEGHCGHPLKIGNVGSGPHLDKCQ